MVTLSIFRHHSLIDAIMVLPASVIAMGSLGSKEPKEPAQKTRARSTSATTLGALSISRQPTTMDLIRALLVSVTDMGFFGFETPKEPMAQTWWCSSIFSASKLWAITTLKCSFFILWYSVSLPSLSYSGCSKGMPFLSTQFLVEYWGWFGGMPSTAHIFVSAVSTVVPR